MKVKLAAWAEKNYDPPPSIRTLRGWVRSGQIFPQPELVGRDYMVDETAVRIPPPRGRVPEAANEGNMSATERALYEKVMRAA